MITKRFQIVAGSALALAISIAAARPRVPEPDNVSLDFMLAALSQNGDFSVGAARPNVLPGRISPVFEKSLELPPGSTLLGSVLWARTTDVFGVATGTVDDVRRWFDGNFVKRGMVMVDQRGVSPIQGGFRDASAGGAGGYCNAEGQYFTVSVRPRPSNGVEFRVRVASSGQCGFSGAGGGFRDAASAPLLYTPPMAQTVQRCADYADYSARVGSAGISTSLSPQDILANYQKQLERAGWKRTNAPSSASATWAKHDTSGSDLLVTVNVTMGTESDCRGLDMRFKEAKK